MFNLNFKDTYKVVHLNNELGNHVIGGAGTYMNELYKYRSSETGFIYMHLGSPLDDFKAADFLEQEDILILHREEAWKLLQIKCDILVVQFYELAFCLTQEVIKDKKIVYVIHSVPTPEPPPQNDPFGGNNSTREKFEYVCNISDILVCVSEAEKKKLSDMYPEYADKIKVVYDGISNTEQEKVNDNYKNSRKIFGFIGRLDYRKGILESIKEFKDIDGEYRIACPKNDSAYFEKILTYMEGAKIQDKVRFYGWCVGKRKESFLDSLDALIIPSLYEPFGYVALEAMQRGLIVISSDNGGLDEILEDYKYKYDPYTAFELRNKIEEFISDSNGEVERQQNILLKNLKKFSAEKMVNDYEEIWEQL